MLHQYYRNRDKERKQKEKTSTLKALPDFKEESEDYQQLPLLSDVVLVEDNEGYENDSLEMSGGGEMSSRTSSSVINEVKFKVKKSF